MNDGRIEQMDTPVHIYNNPINEFTARFVGFENFVSLSKEKDGYRSPSGALFSADRTDAPALKAACRPDDIILSEEPMNGFNHLKGEIVVTTFLGKRLQYLVKTREGDFLVNTDADQQLPPHEPVSLFFPPEKTIFVTA